MRGFPGCGIVAGKLGGGKIAGTAPGGKTAAAPGGGKPGGGGTLPPRQAMIRGLIRSRIRQNAGAAPAFWRMRLPQKHVLTLHYPPPLSANSAFSITCLFHQARANGEKAHPVALR